MKQSRPGAPRNPVEAEDQKAFALTQAALNGAKRLGLSPGDTAAILGVQQGTLLAMKKGQRSVDGNSSEAERADSLVRIVKRLHALLGAETAWRSWIRRDNAALKDKPLDLMLQRDGALQVAAYLEGAREL